MKLLKRYLLALLALALGGQVAHAVTPVGTPTQAGAINQASPLAYSYTTPATGGNRCLITFVYAYDPTGDVTGVTYNSVAMTFVGRVDLVDINGTIEIWRLVNPATGANNVSIAASATMDELFSQSSSYEDCDQTTPVGTPVTGAFGTYTTLTLGTITLDANEVSVGATYYYNNNITPVTETDTLLIETEATTAASGRASQRGDSALGWTFGSSTGGIAIGAAINHSAFGGGSTTPLRRRRSN